MQNVPQVNVVTNFKNLEVCEENFKKILIELKAIIKKDQ